ncbi:MAG: polyphosphate kinase 2 family protein [Tepidisphaerales bacterium]
MARSHRKGRTTTAAVSDACRVREGTRVKLHLWPTDTTGAFVDSHGEPDKAAAEADISRNLAELRKLQEVLYADGRKALLVVFQAMDAGGKDGAIRSLFSGVNPQGCMVHSFKQPSTLERQHDFLWRHHYRCPPKGMIGIHNRSHYEAVLVERVKGIVPPAVWKSRYARIREFERLLVDEGTTVLKFFLHISKDEQKRRLQARLSDPDKQWKFSVADLEERKRWDEYQHAYEDAISECSTSYAPWYIVPSDYKWYRNWVVSDVLVRTLRDMKLSYPKPDPGLARVKVV